MLLVRMTSVFAIRNSIWLRVESANAPSLDKIRTETAETLRRYRQATFDNPGYREFIQQRDRNVAAYRDFLVRQKNDGQAPDAGAEPTDDK